MEKLKGYIEQLADHLQKNLKKGYTMESLKISLINQGYSKISVENAIDLTNKKLAEKAPLMKEKPVITYKIFEKTDSEDVEPIDNSNFFKKILRLKKSFFKIIFRN